MQCDTGAFPNERYSHKKKCEEARQECGCRAPAGGLTDGDTPANCRQVLRSTRCDISMSESGRGDDVGDGGGDGGGSGGDSDGDDDIIVGGGNNRP